VILSLKKVLQVHDFLSELEAADGIGNWKWPGCTKRGLTARGLRLDQKLRLWALNGLAGCRRWWPNW
jgi:hypothetical protein